MAKDPYASLGVKRSATQDEIKAAYRELAKKLHPDLNPGNKEAEQRFKDVNEAYTILSDPKKREEFDRFGGAAFGGPGRQGPFYYETQEPDSGGRYSSSFSFGGRAGESESVENIFESIFGRMGGQGNFSERFGEQARRPEQLYQMEIELRDAVLGGQRDVTLPNGRRLSVRIPPGVDSGTRLRVASGGRTGDVYIELEVRPSVVFKRSGKDLEIELPISFSEAILGGEVRVPVIDGNVMLKIPPGVTTGSKLRLRGKGVQAQGSSQAGDQIVTLKIAMPKKIDAELREWVEKWSKKHSYDPRELIWRDLEREGHHAA